MGASYEYGSGKIENLIGVIGAWFVVLSTGYIVYTAIGRLLSPVTLEPGPLAMGSVIMFLSMVTCGYLWVRNYRINKKIASPVTDIQWRVPMVDTLIAGGILISLQANFFDEYVRFNGVHSRKTGSRVYIEIFLEFDPDVFCDRV